MGRSFTNETRKAFSTKKREGHVARARWARENAGVRLRSLASDLVWFDELRASSTPPPVVTPRVAVFEGPHIRKLAREDVAGFTPDELRLLRNQTCRGLGKIGKQLNVPGIPHVEREWLRAEYKLLNMNCTTMTNVLIEMKEPLTKPKVVPASEKELP